MLILEVYILNIEKFITHIIDMGNIDIEGEEIWKKGLKP